MKISKKLDKRITIAFVVFLLSTWSILIYIDSVSTDKKFDNFYNHKISGRISALSMPRSYIQIQLAGSNEQHDCHQETSSYLKNDFYY